MANTSQQNGSEQALADYEKDLAAYLQERIKPGLSSSAIPLLARSIAKEITRREPPEMPDEDSQDDEGPDLQADEGPDSEADEEEPDSQADEGQPDSEADEEEPESEPDEEEPDSEADKEESASEADEEQPDFEANMHELQADLGDEWVLHFSVHGDDGWLAAEKQDGTQRVEAPDARGLITIIDAIDECGGRQP